MSPAQELPWDAEEDAHQVLAELPLSPRAPTVDGQQRRYTPLPPPVPDFDDEPSVTPSLRAPKDLPLPESAPRKRSAKQVPSTADFIRAVFSQRVYGAARYRLRLGEPTGASAGGKRKTREPLLLVPSKGSEPAILVGWLDVARKEAQVRGHGVMELLHESRYGDMPDLREEEYERFLDKLMDALFEGGIRLVMLVPDMLDQEPTLANPMPPSAAQRSAQAVSGAALPTQHSPLTMRKGALLMAMAFVLGLSAQPVFSWTAGAIHWLTHAPTWIQQASLVLH